MKKLLVTMLVCLTAISFASVVLASEFGAPNEDSDTVVVSASVGKYASVEAHKLIYDHTNCWWFIIPFWETYWSEADEALMDFGEFSGAPGKNKIRDTNYFIVETNTAIDVEFSGKPLTRGTSVLPTKYWAFTSQGIDNDLWPLPMWQDFPKQLVPRKNIGFFGAGNAPDWNGLANFDVPAEEWELMLLGAAQSWPALWPKDNDVIKSTRLNGKGIYPFQVFGIAGTGANISDQENGEYWGEIKLTVSAAVN